MLTAMRYTHRFAALCAAPCVLLARRYMPLRNVESYSHYRLVGTEDSYFSYVFYPPPTLINNNNNIEVVNGAGASDPPGSDHPPGEEFSRMSRPLLPTIRDLEMFGALVTDESERGEAAGSSSEAWGSAATTETAWASASALTTAAVAANAFPRALTGLEPFAVVAAKRRRCAGNE